ncbi:tetratricopeptide repeat protein [Orientia tsutsugamushi]|nr:tetratricopeptide repeat protein [Orientia tsutsugamushi]
MAIKYQPDDAEAYFNKGMSLRALGQHQEAIENYGQAIQYNPTNLEVYINKGVALYKLGQYQRSNKAL